MSHVARDFLVVCPAKIHYSFLTAIVWFGNLSNEFLQKLWIQLENISWIGIRNLVLRWIYLNFSLKFKVGSRRSDYYYKLHLQSRFWKIDEDFYHHGHFFATELLHCCMMMYYWLEHLFLIVGLQIVLQLWRRNKFKLGLPWAMSSSSLKTNLKHFFKFEVR